MSDSTGCRSCPRREPTVRHMRFRIRTSTVRHTDRQKDQAPHGAVRTPYGNVPYVHRTATYATLRHLTSTVRCRNAVIPHAKHRQTKQTQKALQQLAGLLCYESLKRTGPVLITSPHASAFHSRTRPRPAGPSGALPAHPHLSSLHVFSRAQRTRVYFFPQHWLLCHLVCLSSSSSSIMLSCVVASKLKTNSGVEVYMRKPQVCASHTVNRATQELSAVPKTVTSTVPSTIPHTVSSTLQGPYI
jgi:hypothetical protein